MHFKYYKFFTDFLASQANRAKTFRFPKLHAQDIGQVLWFGSEAHCCQGDILNANAKRYFVLNLKSWQAGAVCTPTDDFEAHFTLLSMCYFIEK